MKIILITLFILSSFRIFGLEIDEKLTSRFLNVSGSKKTVLINRGLEDGLVVGDHAKFFVTTGVIARGVVVKASPTRSIWSVYRIIDGQKIFSDKVVNIKIASPVKISEDPSKSIYEGEYPQNVEVVRSENIDREEIEELTKEEQLDVGQMQAASEDELNQYSERQSLQDAALEVYGLLHVSSLGSSIDQQSSGSYTGGSSQVNFTIGAEKYLSNWFSFLESSSLFVKLHRNTSQVTSVQSSSVTTSVMEYGAGLNFHFGMNKMRTHEIIYYGQLGLGIGNVEDSSETIANGASTTTTIDGSSSSYQVGVGVKYFFNSGFGLRAKLDYYVRNESYTFSDTNETYTKKLSGPRVLAGLSYLF